MTAAHADPVSSHTEWLSVTVNQSVKEGLWACRVEGDRLWLSQTDLARLGLQTPESPEEWQELTALPGLRVKYDPLGQHLSVDAQPHALKGNQRLNGKPAPSQIALAQAQPIGTLSLDYALYASNNAGQRQASARTLLRASGWLPGEFSSSFNSRFSNEGHADERGHTRLMSRWQWDHPASLTSVAAGDNVSNGVSWSRQLRYGGIQLARNFALNPQINTAPPAQYRDSAALPSTVDLYLDGLKQSSQQVSPGNFTLDTQPGFSGNGQAQVVITDINGQRRTVTLDLYGAPTMLAEGLSSASLDLGWMRENYALHSSDYASKPMAQASWRYGIRNALTLSLHGEGQQRLVNGGIGADWLIAPQIGILSHHQAWSEGRYGAGRQWGLGWQWNGGGLGVAVNTTRTDGRYADNARISGGQPVRRSDTLWLSRTLGRFGTIGSGYVRQSTNDLDQRYLNLSWSTSLPGQAALSLTWTRAFSGGEQSGQLTLTLPFGRRDTLTLQTGGTAHGWDYRHQPDTAQGGWAWAMGGRHGSDREAWAELGHQGRNGEWRLGIDNRSRAHSRYAQAEGSVTLLDSALYALPYNTQGLALVSTDGVGGVPIALENRPMGETDAHGYLLLTDLPRWHSSKITIDPLNLPPEMLIPVTDIAAQPGTVAAVKADFSVRKAASLQARLIDNHHQPLAMGSLVSWPGGSSIVGRDGFIWLQDPPRPGVLTVRTTQGRCRAVLPVRLTATTEEIACH